MFPHLCFAGANECGDRLLLPEHEVAVETTNQPVKWQLFTPAWHVPLWSNNFLAIRLHACY